MQCDKSRTLAADPGAKSAPARQQLNSNTSARPRRGAGGRRAHLQRHRRHGKLSKELRRTRAISSGYSATAATTITTRQTELAGASSGTCSNRRRRSDAWFCDLVRQGRDIHPRKTRTRNSASPSSGSTLLIRDGNDILEHRRHRPRPHVLENVGRNRGPGVTSMFVDHDGAIQLHRNRGA